MTDKEKFRQEVEKLKSNLMYGACSSQIAMETMCNEEAYNEVLAILHTMQEGPVSEDIGSMADKYHKEVLIGECQMTDDMAGHCRLSYYLGLKDGAKWQKKRDYIPLSDNINEVARQICNKVLNCEIDYKEDDVVLSDEEECVKAGIRWQMQKESIVSEDLEKTSKVWHDSNKEQPKTETTVVIWHPNDKYGEVLTRCVEVYSDRIWAYMDDLLRM
jgi:hypothetical protein